MDAAAAVRRVDLRWLLFALIALNTLSPVLTGNEEEYFAFAKAFVDPQWVPGSQSLRDVPGSRIVTDTVLGHLLGVLPFEAVALGGRLLAAALLAVPLARLAGRVGLGHLGALVLVQLLCSVSHQSFFAKEWIIGSFESKGVAYAFVLWCLVHLLDRRLVAAVACLAAATWFHVLVGGWTTIVVALHLAGVARVPLRRLVALAALYAAIVAPLAAYLAAFYLTDNPNVIDGVVVSRVYAFFRNPHHLDLLGQLRGGSVGAWTGLVLTLGAAALAVRLLRASADAVLRTLAGLLVMVVAQQLASLAAAWVDTDGVFLKFYPYRTSALAFVLTLLVVARLAADPGLRTALPRALRFERPRAPRAPGRGAAGLAAAIALALGVRVAHNLADVARVVHPPPQEAARLAMYQWIRSHTAPDAVFLDLGPAQGNADFIRRTGRESYAVFKFVPTTNRLIHAWYLRVLDQRRAVADPQAALALARAGRIRYLIGPTPLADPAWRLVHEEAGVRLYTIASGG